jgi:hypothetical protein
MDAETEDGIEVERFAPATQRLIALAKGVDGLGHAIAGVGNLRKAGAAMEQEVKDLISQQLWMAKRLSWVERQADPDWKPWKDRDLE